MIATADVKMLLPQLTVLAWFSDPCALCGRKRTRLVDQRVRFYVARGIRRARALCADCACGQRFAPRPGFCFGPQT